MSKAIELTLAPTKNIEWRFGVRDDEGRRSQSFGIYTYRDKRQPHDDIYIAGRSMGGSMKVSLHASGDCQVGLSSDFVEKNPLPPGQSRHFDRWQQPVVHTEGFYLQYSLKFPTDHLRPMEVGTKNRNVKWLPAAPQGQVLEVLVCTAEPSSWLSLNFQPKTFPIAAELMTDRRYLLLAGRIVPPRPLSNQSHVAKDVEKTVRSLDLEVNDGHRLLVGFTMPQGLRGWLDYSLAQYMAVASA